MIDHPFVSKNPVINRASLYTCSRLSVPLLNCTLLDRFGSGVMLTTLVLCTLAVTVYAWQQRKAIAIRLLQP